MATIILLSVLILLHEAGHFLAARKFGVKVEEFGIGLPPRMLRLFKRGDTDYTLNWLPIGGFVRLFGEDNDLTTLEKVNPFTRNKSFASKPTWQRAIILFAGIFTNFLVGILLFSFIYSVSGVPHIDRNLAVVTQVVKGSPADLAGFTEGDAVVSVDSVGVSSSIEFVDQIKDKKGQAVTFRVAALLPDGKLSPEQKVISAIPRENPPAGEGALGVGVSTLPILVYDKKPWYTAPFYGMVEGAKESYAWGKEIVRGLGTLLGSIIRGQLPEGISGPVGVVRAGEKVSEAAGIMGLLRFGAILSINLAIFNLLPFFGLDGGRLMFLGLEKIIGRKWVNKYEGYIHTGGVIVLLGLLLVVTWKDIWG